jgi:acyl-CoA thioesterase-1
MIGSVMRWLSTLALPRYGRSGAAGKLCALLVAVSCLAGAADARPVVVAALGDSLVQGYGLPPADGLVPQLQAWLDARGVEATLVNAGVSGDTSAGALARTDWTLAPEVGALIVAIGGNDLLRGLDPAVTRANVQAILQRAADRGVPVLLVGIEAPGNYGADYKAAFDAIFPELAAATGALYHPGFFPALRSGGDQAALATLMQADGIHPNAAGVARIVEAFGPAVEDLVRRAAE